MQNHCTFCPPWQVVTFIITHFETLFFIKVPLPINASLFSSLLDTSSYCFQFNNYFTCSLFPSSYIQRTTPFSGNRDLPKVTH